MTKVNIYKRLMIISGFTCTVAAFLVSFFHKDFEHCIIPFANIVIPAIHAASSILIIILFILPLNQKLQATIFFLESFACVFTGYDYLGLILYTGFLITLYFDFFFDKKIILKFAIFSVIWIAIAIGIIPYGIDRFLLLIVSTIFFDLFMLNLYYKFSSFNKVITPVTAYKNSKIPKPGSELFISSLKLSERQQKVLYLFATQKLNYQQIASELNISVSTVKHEMKIIFDYFYIPNQVHLFALLSQYIVKP